MSAISIEYRIECAPPPAPRPWSSVACLFPHCRPFPLPPNVLSRSRRPFVLQFRSHVVDAGGTNSLIRTPFGKNKMSILRTASAHVRAANVLERERKGRSHWSFVLAGIGSPRGIEVGIDQNCESERGVSRKNCAAARIRVILIRNFAFSPGTLQKLVQNRPYTADRYTTIIISQLIRRWLRFL